MQRIERYGVIALVFLLVTVAAVSFWGEGRDDDEAPGGEPVAHAGERQAVQPPSRHGQLRNDGEIQRIHGSNVPLGGFRSCNASSRVRLIQRSFGPARSQCFRDQQHFRREFPHRHRLRQVECGLLANGACATAANRNGNEQNDNQAKADALHNVRPFNVFTPVF